VDLAVRKPLFHSRTLVDFQADIKNVLFSNIKVDNVTLPLSFTQCISYSNTSGDCNSSLFKISNVSFVDMQGTAQEEPVASLQCSAKAPCENTTIEDVTGLELKNGTQMTGFNCDNVMGTVGFNCTGHTCENASADGTC
jgi:galacturan 1,4-alpha-galacturonidase